MAVKKPPRAVVPLTDLRETVNLMLYGDPGCGKTELAAYLPGKVLIISSEDGASVIRRGSKRSGLTARDLKRFNTISVRAWQDLEEIFEWLRDGAAETFDWLVIDSLTSLDERSMRAAMERAVRLNPEKRDIDLPDRGEHQKRQNAMKRMVADFNELPVNVLWTANAMRRENKDGDEIVVPFVTGKDYEVSAWVCAQMGAYLYMGKRAETDGKKSITKRFLVSDTMPDSDRVVYWAKDRFQVMPRTLVIARGEEQAEPNFGHYIAAMLESAAGGAGATSAEPEEPEDEPDETEEPEPEEDDSEPEEEAEEAEDTMSESEYRDWLSSKASKDEIRAEAEEAGVKITGLTKAAAVDAIAEAMFPNESDEEDEPEPDEEDETLSDEDFGEEPEDEPDETEDDGESDGLEEMSVASLRKVLQEMDLEEAAKGKKKDGVIRLIRETRSASRSAKRQGRLRAVK